MTECFVFIAATALALWAAEIPARWILAVWGVTVLAYGIGRAVFAVLSLHP